MHVSGLFATIVRGLEEDKVKVSPLVDFGSRTLTSFMYTQLPTIALTEYVYVLARIAVADRQLFLQLVSATATALNMSEEKVWEPILNQWWTRVRSQAPHLLSLQLGSLTEHRRHFFPCLVRQYV